VQGYLFKWPRCRYLNIGEEWKIPLQISLLEVCLARGVQVLRLATFIHVGRGADIARLSPRAKRAKSDWWATVTLGCPWWIDYARLARHQPKTRWGPMPCCPNVDWPPFCFLDHLTIFFVSTWSTPPPKSILKIWSNHGGIIIEIIIIAPWSNFHSG
jgi:hypothetical protein